MKKTNEISLLGTAMPTKLEAQLICNTLFNAVDGGSADPMKLAVRIKWLKDIVTDIEKKIKPYVLIEVDKLSSSKRESAVVLGAKITAKETGTKYDYTRDKTWSELNTKVEVAEKKRSEREAYLKSLKKKVEVIHKPTGEIRVDMPPIKTSVSSYAIELSIE